ncbi:MAG TPA: gfo/Idh/MocA family oxidoreductase, partial [Candidatus Kryptobacter bacterium]|nr:gfo/Idh/MocA family oxidoreductase [Candidatus Kryptobacter bacterium]
WKSKSVRSLLAKIVTERPDKNGKMVPCETWDNAILACDTSTEGYTFPFIASMKRIAPGNGNTWFIRINGTKLSAEFTTKNPKQLAYLPYSPGDEQAWRMLDVSYASAYSSITGGIFEFGFPDSIVQMWAAFCDELVNGDRMKQPFGCATPKEAAATHRLFTAALESQRTGQTIMLD